MNRVIELIIALLLVAMLVADRVYVWELSSYSANKNSHYHNKAPHNQEKAESPFLALAADIENFVETHEKIFIVLSTIAIAWFTGTLWRSTTGLQDLAAKQSVDMERSLTIAEKSAAAAETSAGVASAALVITQRAWLTAKEFKADAIRDGENVLEWKFSIVFENSGNTPAQKASAGIVLVEVVRGKQEPGPFYVTNPSASASAVIGNRAIITGGGAERKDHLSLEQIKRMTSGEIDVYLCGRADYKDIFEASPARYTSVCMRLVVEDPTFKRPNPFGYYAHDKYNEAT